MLEERQSPEEEAPQPPEQEPQPFEPQPDEFQQLDQLPLTPQIMLPSDGILPPIANNLAYQEYYNMVRSEIAAELMPYLKDDGLLSTEEIVQYLRSSAAMYGFSGPELYDVARITQSQAQLGVQQDNRADAGRLTYFAIGNAEYVIEGIQSALLLAYGDMAPNVTQSELMSQLARLPELPRRDPDENPLRR